MINYYNTVAAACVTLWTPICAATYTGAFANRLLGCLSTDSSVSSLASLSQKGDSRLAGGRLVLISAFIRQSSGPAPT